MLTRLNWLFWETLIIVVGVLIALSVNDYWSDRTERKLELEYVQRLRADVQTDHDVAVEHLADRLPRKLLALDTIAPVVRGQEPVPEDLESFLVEVGMGGLGGVSPSKPETSTTFEDLLVTGNLRLIRDAEMRRKLVDYYRNADEFINRQRARVTDYPRFTHSILPSELRKGVNLEAMDTFGVERAVSKIRSPEFEDLLNQEYNFAWFTVQAYELRRDNTAHLLEELDAYILSLEQ